ncbi:transmembrane protein 161B-like [Mizuhopecten yessoensis]|uniref:Transmembrane protein 161B n=1 Tax=Mizuhopecten yessoensis TaxID=6573 RepID=A0A210QJA3_MIZYE|nr:transmembrane protein 161B-like [Mizuhopecten yessoensis]XP_021356884.1 transmembrane protein 161B-like [Mizuhopecten yessoensis]OWF48820.1 Transmembrane protein 161B [Mizuhopecten yessoensis]
MTILGAQLVFSLIVFSLLQKLAKHFSFGRWLLCGKLFRFLHPTDAQIREVAGLASSTAPNKAKNRKFDNRKDKAGAGNAEGFSVPRSIPLELDTAPVELIDLLQLKFYDEYQWLMDFSVSAVVVYILTEIYFTLGQRSEMNISILWCLLAVGFCLRLLVAQTAMYFKSDEGGEKILCVTFGFFFLVVAMGVLVIDSGTLELGLQEGYSNFSESATQFLKEQGLESHGPVSFLTFKIILTFLCSFIGALLTFPGLRYAKLHLDTLKYYKEQRVMQALLQLNFVMPIIILLMWFKPIGRDVICAKHWKVTYQLMNEPMFEIWRISLIVIFIVLRLCLLTPHLQSHLNVAYIRLENLKKETGRVNSRDLQKMVARVFYYLCVVALQYITPLVLLLFLTFLQKTLGDFSWSAMFGESVEDYVTSLSVGKANIAPTNATTPINEPDSVTEAVAQFSWAMTNLRLVFSPQWYRGLLAFVVWWVGASWFTCTAFGIYYYSKISS